MLMDRARGLEARDDATALIARFAETRPEARRKPRETEG
jgi:hypothetical protein